MKDLVEMVLGEYYTINGLTIPEWWKVEIIPANAALLPRENVICFLKTFFKKKLFQGKYYKEK